MTDEIDYDRPLGDLAGKPAGGAKTPAAGGAKTPAAGGAKTPVDQIEKKPDGSVIVTLRHPVPAHTDTGDLRKIRLRPINAQDLTDLGGEPYIMPSVSEGSARDLSIMDFQPRHEKVLPWLERLSGHDTITLGQMRVIDWRACYMALIFLSLETGA